MALGALGLLLNRRRICKRGAGSLALTVCHFPPFSGALRWVSSKYSGNYFSRRDVESAVKQ